MAQPQPPPQLLLQDVVVLDNGGSTCKLGSALRPGELKCGGG